MRASQIKSPRGFPVYEQRSFTESHRFPLPLELNKPLADARLVTGANQDQHQPAESPAIYARLNRIATIKPISNPPATKLITA